MTYLTSIPPDRALPHAPSLFDPDLMSAILGRSLPPDRRPRDVRIKYVRYRPAKSIVVTYKITVGETANAAFAWVDADADLPAHAMAPKSAELVAKVDRRTPARTPLAYESELDALIQWLPLDVALPAMAEPAERLRDRIMEAGLEIEADDVPRIVKHKPMTRGVLRFAHHVAKVYADGNSLAAAVRALEASSSLPFPTAQCTTVVPELLLATQSLVPGTRPDGGAETTGQAGALLAVLHAVSFNELPVELPRDLLRRGAGQTRLLKTVVPSLATRLDRLMARLEAGLPSDKLVSSHGDFRDGQLLQSDGELGVVDFDYMCAAPAARDIANYAASLVQRADDLTRAAETLDVLVEAYGRRPPGVPWYLANHLLRRARSPFVRWAPDWPAKVEERLEAAESALEL